MPTDFKEARNWKSAEPSDDKPRGNWWEVFGDPASPNARRAGGCIELADIARIHAQYRQAQAAAQEARAGFFPDVGVSASATAEGHATGFNGFTRSRRELGTGSWGGVARRGSGMHPGHRMPLLAAARCRRSAQPRRCRITSSCASPMKSAYWQTRTGRRLQPRLADHAEPVLQGRHRHARRCRLKSRPKVEMPRRSSSISRSRVRSSNMPLPYLSAAPGGLQFDKAALAQACPTYP